MNLARGFDADRFDSELEHRGLAKTLENVKAELQHPAPVRTWAVAKAFELGLNVRDVHELTMIDCWFLTKLHNVHILMQTIRSMRFKELSVGPPFAIGSA